MLSTHILLPTDLSDEALRAFPAVRDLARKTGAKVTLLHVVFTLLDTSAGERMGTPVGPPDYESEVLAAQEALEAQAETLSGGLDLEVRAIQSTNVAKAIASYAVEHDVSLIALSTHGRSGFRRLLLGSVAEELLRHAEVPVLCFPRHE